MLSFLRHGTAVTEQRDKKVITEIVSACAASWAYVVFLSDIVADGCVQTNGYTL
jgi:hypothetical protein